MVTSANLIKQENMIQYIELAKFILKNGTWKPNRTNYKALSFFGYQMRFDLSKNLFPLITTKKMFFKGIVHELLWFIKGDTNIKYLVDHNVHIWDNWVFQKYQKSQFYQNETLPEFQAKIKNDSQFAQKFGNLGPIYGKQWRNFNNIDQLKNIIDEIKKNPFSRRLVVNAWNPVEIMNMALPPCHVMFQFYVNNKQQISLSMYQRSADLFLGVPFNIASYSLLLLMVAKECNLKPLEFVHFFGDIHLYENHIKQIEIQIKRKPLPLPYIWLNPSIKSIFDYQAKDIKLKNYQSHGLLKGKIAV